MKNSIKFISEVQEKIILLDEADNIIKLYVSKVKGEEIKETLEQIKNSFKETMYKIIESGVKNIDFEKLTKEGKELLTDFISTIDVKYLEAKDKPLMNELENILKLYASKRRGEEVTQNFEELKQSFCECMKKMIKEGVTNFQPEKLQPFALELFDKFTEYKYIVAQPDGNQQAFNTLKELKDSGTDYRGYKFDIKMKEAEKKIGNFALYHQWWKGKHLESKSLDSFIIATDLKIDLFLDVNPLNENFKEAVFYIKPSKYEVMKVNESTTFVAPRSNLNITEMPAWMKIVDMGKIAILESTELEKTIEFMGTKLKGIFVAKRDTESSDFWSIKKESKHSHDKCMDCSDPPKYEVKWAEGMGHAWFCESHFKTWSDVNKDDIDYVKEVKDGRASDKFADNPNPNIKDTIFK